MKAFAISLTLLAWALPTVASELISPTAATLQGKLRTKDWQRAVVDPAQSPPYVEVTRDVELACQTEGSRSLPRTMTMLKGAYPIELRLHPKKGGADWLLVPVVSSEPVKFGYNNSAGRTWGYEHAIALNSETLALFPREVVGYTQEWSRLDRSRWNEATWTFGCVQRVAASHGLPALRFISDTQFRAARDGQVREDVLGVLDDALQRKQALDRERPSKAQIGVQLCKSSGALILQGFTEGKSPDNNKIQIRIWRASLSDRGKPSTVVPGDFRESLVWDNPDNWQICEN